MKVLKRSAPEIINTDQGSQFTNPTFKEYLGGLEQARFSMDGKGRTIDNIFIEQFWSNIKYEKDLYETIGGWPTYMAKSRYLNFF